VLEFLVKWRGYSQKHNTWEPIENLNDAAQQEAKALLLDEKNVMGTGIGTIGR